jgi:hypothetical protein
MRTASRRPHHAGYGQGSTGRRLQTWLTDPRHRSEPRIGALGERVVHPPLVAADVDGGAGDGHGREAVTAVVVDPRRLQPRAAGGIRPSHAVVADLDLGVPVAAADRHRGDNHVIGAVRGELDVAYITVERPVEAGGGVLKRRPFRVHAGRGWTRLIIAAWSRSRPPACLKLPITISFVPSGLTSIAFGPTAPLRRCRCSCGDR